MSAAHFERILVVGSPGRTDRQDALTLQAAVSHMKLSWITARHGKDIAAKALPDGVEREVIGDIALSTWRGHVDAVQTIVTSRLSSALILADDIDWDVRLKTQLLNFARGVRFVLSTPKSARTASPYGDNWDVLWMGHCSERFPANDPGRYIIEDDPSTPSHKHLRAQSVAGAASVTDDASTPLAAHLDKALFTIYPEHSRVVHRAAAPRCAFAYALSASGAKKVLWGLSVRGLQHATFDEALAAVCNDPSLDPKCISVQPQYFFRHRPHRSSSALAKKRPGSGEVRGSTPNIRWSVRMNLEALISGRRILQDQFPDQEVSPLEGSDA
ncbi:MAG: hypothetical protein M1825_004923 [Sarcosagium campestre]|nr:MAG: hypothetical protein M1825_004923 [Sarcosagium campestre]